MSDFKPTPESALTTAQMMERYQLKDEATLQAWARLHAIESDRDLYTPTQVDVIDHVHHHIYNLAMSMEDYQRMLENRRQNRLTREESEPKIAEDRSRINSADKTFYTEPQGIEKVAEENNYIATELTEDASEAIEMLTEQYAEAIDVMGERIADRFIDELDLSVMRHLAQKVKDRRKLNGKSKPNRFLKTIQAVLPAKGSNVLVPRKSESSSIELEQNHRLG